MATNESVKIEEMRNEIANLIKESNSLRHRCAALEEQLSIAKSSVWISENETNEKEATRRRA